MGTPYYVPALNYPNEEEIDSADNLTISHGNQTFNVGGELRWAQDNIVQVIAPPLRSTFQSRETGT